MFEFKHPKYYKNLRKLARLRNRDQAISLQAPTGDAGRAPGTGLNHRRQEATGPGAEASSDKPQASSDKQEVTSYKLPGPRPISNANKGLIHKPQATKPQASSDKHQAPSNKRQASSRKRQAPQ